VAGSGDAAKGAAALKGVTIPMFSAKGLAIKRSNGEVVTPFYFAYEDLREDWGKLVEQAEAAEEEEGATRAVKKLAAKPKVRFSLSRFPLSQYCISNSSRASTPFCSPLLALCRHQFPSRFLFYTFSSSTFCLPSPLIPFPITTSGYSRLLRIYLARWK
jgi:hypothetical protein